MARGVAVHCVLPGEPEPGQLLPDARLAEPGQRDLPPRAAGLGWLAGAVGGGHDALW